MTRVVGTGASRGGPYHGQQGQRRQAPGRLGAGHGLPPVPLDGLTGRVGQRSGAPAAASGENEGLLGAGRGSALSYGLFQKATQRGSVRSTHLGIMGL